MLADSFASTTSTNCTAVAEALCTADGACASFGVFGSKIQLHGCTALVPNADWQIYNRTSTGEYVRVPGAVNVNEDACAVHPKTGMDHSCAPPPPPPGPSLYKRMGSIDVGTFENTIFYWARTDMLYLIENIPCSYVEHAGIWDPSWGNHSYGRIREFVSGRVIANISSSIGFGFISAFVDDEHGRAWLFGTPADRCSGNGSPTSVQAWWSEDLLTWQTALAFDYGQATHNVQVTKVGPMRGDKAPNTTAAPPRCRRIATPCFSSASPGPSTTPPMAT